MPRVPDTPCALCGRLLWSSTTSLPPGQRTCRTCRRTRKAANKLKGCQICGAEFVGSGNRKRCTPCGAAFPGRSRPCIECGQRCSGDRCQACSSARFRQLRSKPTPCVVCGAELPTSRRTRCAGCVVPRPPKAERPAPPSRRRRQALRTIQRAEAGQWRDGGGRWLGPAIGGVFTSGRCCWCGGEFTRWGPTPCIACSDRCAKKIRKSRRRALVGPVGTVDRMAVFERDDWRCQLCLMPALPDWVVPHPDAPTIDHIVPLARGGTHTMDNVQTAHFLCNSIKGDRPELPRVGGASSLAVTTHS